MYIGIGKSSTETLVCDMKTNKKRSRQLAILITLMVVLAVVVALISVRYFHMERDASLTRLQEQTQYGAQRIRLAVKSSQSYLEEMALPVYDAYTTSEADGRNTLATFGSTSIISRMELLMPDGTLYTPYGQSTEPTLSYERMAQQDFGVTRRSLDKKFSNSYIVRLYVPVRRDTRTLAVLCGVVEVENLSVLLQPSIAYGEKATLSLFEGETGNYLIGGRSAASPGNIRDAENYNFVRGYSKDAFFEDVRTGNSGSTLMQDPATGDNYRVYYIDVGIQDWMAALSVPESVVFSHANLSIALFVIMIALLAAIVIPFLLWFLRDVRRREARNEVEFEGMRYSLEIQQTLFRAHMNPNAFHQALEEMAHYLSADATVLYFADEEGRIIQRSLGGSATKAPPKKADLQAVFPGAAKAVMEEGHFAGNRPSIWEKKDRESAQEIGIRNMMLVRLDTLDGSKTLGVLAAINVDVFWEDTAPLDQVSFTFTMALENYQNYQILARMGQVDELTGLMNRNYYQTRLEELGDLEGGMLGCIYMDANGLHEINNHLGHDAGDEMLRSVADALLSNFDKQNTFRLGGDEFAVLVRNMPPEELERLAKKVADTVDKCGYSVSVGIEFQEGHIQIHSLVAAAEAAMRQSKAEYYANQGGERQMRNLKEQSQSAKQDADDILSALAPSFAGIYFVSPQNDACRPMVASDFFLDFLAEAKDSFQGAMDLYIQERVAPEDQQAMVDFCRYDTLVEQLATGDRHEVDITYHRVDGKVVHLQVRQPRRTGDDQHEIMWLFSMRRDDR